MLKRLWNEDEGVLTFEWILLLTLLVIGVIGGVAGIRDAIIHEAQGVVDAMISTDVTYTVQPPLGVGVKSQANDTPDCTSSAVGFFADDIAGIALGRDASTEQSQVNKTTTLCEVK